MKKLLKASVDLTAMILVTPALAAYYLAKMAIGKDKAFPGWSQLFALLPGITGVYLRRAFYRLVLQRCSAGCWIGFGTIFSHGSAEVGRNAYVGCYCCLGDVSLGDDVLLGSHVSIMNGAGQHGIDRLDIPIREQPGVWPRISVGAGSWVGDRCVIMADVGNHCVIGAGSVVTRPVPDFAIAVGVPARVLRLRNATDAIGKKTDASATADQGLS
jgi:virginiamycin A acetyltransferase